MEARKDETPKAARCGAREPGPSKVRGRGRYFLHLRSVSGVARTAKGSATRKRFCAAGGGLNTLKRRAHARRFLAA